MKQIILFLLLTISFNTFSQNADFKEMMNDNSINFYDVVKEAEVYFNTHNKNVKGSGWKGYQRWRNANEYKYYPSGDRSNIDPFFVKNNFDSFLKNNNVTQQKNRSFTGWNELGPSTISTITGGYSAGLGRIEDHYVDPVNANKMYIGSRSGGFWKSLDGGTTWSGGSTDFLPASGVNTIGVSPSNTDEILINIKNSSNSTSHGIYRSTDGGNTWIQTNFNPANLGVGGLGSNWFINEVAYHPTIPNLVFIATSNGLYRSDDNLATWTNVFSGKCKEIEFHPTIANKMYFYNVQFFKNQVLISSDAGLTFTGSQIVVGNNNNTGVHFSVSPACPDCLYWGSGNGVWKSTDQGSNFTFISNPNAGSGGFAVSDTDNTKMLIGYVDISASNDDGATFNQVTYWSLGNTNGDTTTNQTSFNTSTNYVHADLRKAKCVNGVFYLGTDGFFSKSTDNGATWQILSQGVATRENYKLGVSQSNTERSISGSQDNGTSIKTENGWAEFYGADGMEGIIHPLNDDWMIGSFQYGGRRRTKNGGISQNAATPSGAGNNADWEAPIIYDPNNQMTIYDFRTSVFKSDDFGSTWTNIGTPTFNDIIDEAVIAENDSNIMIATRNENIEKSIDAGVTWVSIRGALPNYDIQDVAFDPNDDDTIIVTYGRYQNDNEKVFISTNGGTTWSNITYNLGNMPIRSVVIDHTTDATIYLGAEIGVYTKPMNGNTWSLYSTDLPNTSISELEIVYGSNTIKAATWGRGLWEFSLVGRNDYPRILTTKISDQPTDLLPKESVDQYVITTIEYNGTLTNVELRWSANNLNFDNTIPMSNSSGNYWVSTAPITNFPEGTKIYFKVFATGSNSDTTETYKFMYTVKSEDFCTTTGTTTSGNLRITNVSITGELSNDSGNTGYTYYNELSPTELGVGETYEISVTANTSWSDNDYGVWIDYNNDKVFDASEQILLSIDESTNNPTAQFTIPLDAVLNETIRMRVNLSYFSDNPQPCSTTFGEVEDYALTFISNTGCTDGYTIWDGILWSTNSPNINKGIIVNADYSTSASGNVTACSCEIETGSTVTVNAGGFLDITGNILVDGTLDVQHEGSVVQTNDLATVINNGNIIVRKTTPTLEPSSFMILGNPMTMETREGVYGSSARILHHITGNFVPNGSVGSGTENFVDDNNNNWDFHTGLLTPAEGYFVKPLFSGDPSGTFDLDYTLGTLNNGVVSYNLLYNGTRESSANMLGNPYASAIDNDAFLGANPLLDAIYYWQHITPPSGAFPGFNQLNYNIGDISVYNQGSGGVAASNGGGIPTQFMASGQGFGVKALGAGPAIFNNSMRVTDPNTDYRSPENNDRQRIWLDLINETYSLYSNMLVAFTQNATDGFENKYDSQRFDTPISLYSVLETGETLAIQGRTAFNLDQEVQLGFNTQIEEVQTYTISINQLEGEDLENTDVYLEDRLLHISTNLSEVDYTFTANLGEQTNRFVLVFIERVLGTNDVAIQNINISPNPTSGMVTIISPNTNIERIEVIDVQGRIILSKKPKATHSSLDLSALESAMYFVKIYTSEGNLIKRVVKK